MLTILLHTDCEHDAKSVNILNTSMQTILSIATGQHGVYEHAGSRPCQRVDAGPCEVRYPIFTNLDNLGF